MNRPISKLIVNPNGDENFKFNCQQLKRELPVNSIINGYQLMKKAEHENFDIQSCWLDIYFTHNKQNFKTRKSYKANQYLNIKLV